MSPRTLRHARRLRRWQIEQGHDMRMRDPHGFICWRASLCDVALRWVRLVRRWWCGMPSPI